MSPVIPVPQRPTRRTVLRGLAIGGATLLLAGCEDTGTGRDPSPTGTVVPDDPQTWPDDSHLLMSARQRIHVHRMTLAATPGSKDSTGADALDQLWSAQIDRLGQLITLGGLPLPELVAPPVVDRPPDDEAGTSAASGGPSAGADDDAAATSSGPEPVDVGRALRAQLPSVVREVATATPTNLAMLASLAAQHADSAARLGAPVDWTPLVGPAGAAAVPVLAVTRPAVFGLEVLAARSVAEERELYESMLDEVRSLTRQLTTLAGSAAPVAPLGYDLPEPLETEDERRSLARALVADIGPAGLGAAERLRGDAAQLTGAVRIVAEAAGWAHQLGAAPEPFPGMTLPS